MKGRTKGGEKHVELGWLFEGELCQCFDSDF